ncbi:pentapeptide repeat-containing protein [Phormidium sp. LEGE 05292]|uniref:pentapeptide repeat-containing protein n=1 Tax=[Phormidium] sp. LEGE 05292 TaxID=767427 RepID=UPI00187FAF09|nr:pentapeptide repeat-containing protein [Phormidium sp. LEGE 05292]MBE9224049.1 pentapeptide repeat-containing protein [Phormidium sp. LEGE 05292]
MKNPLQTRLSSALNQLMGRNLLSEHTRDVLLFDCANAARDIAFMLGGEWDGCNSIVMPSSDEVAVNTAANLVGASWCYQGASTVLLARLSKDELLRRYAVGERNFANANLRCAVLCSEELSQCNLTYVKLNFAELSRANLTGVDLTGADLSDASLSKVNLSQASLYRSLLIRANLSQANLRGANFFKASLNDACLQGADLTGANLSFADLRGAILDEAILSGANLTGAKLTQEQLLSRSS